MNMTRNKNPPPNEDPAHNLLTTIHMRKKSGMQSQPMFLSPLTLVFPAVEAKPATVESIDRQATIDGELHPDATCVALILAG